MSPEDASAASSASSATTPSRWELDLFLHTLYNVNDNLRLQMTLAGGLIAGCVTMLNFLNPSNTGPIVNFVDEMDRFVFIPALISMILSYIGLEHHWNYRRRKSKPPEQMEDLYSMVSYKYRMLHAATACLIVSALLLSTFILIEFH